MYKTKGPLPIILLTLCVKYLTFPFKRSKSKVAIVHDCWMHLIKHQLNRKEIKNRNGQTFYSCIYIYQELISAMLSETFTNVVTCKNLPLTHPFLLPIDLKIVAVVAFSLFLFIVLPLIKCISLHFF